MTDGGSSVSAVRQLLATLVAAKPRGRIAELGTAFGEGASAMAQELAPGRRSEEDPIREALLQDPRVIASEIQTTPTTAAIIAVRRSSQRL